MSNMNSNNLRVFKMSELMKMIRENKRLYLITSLIALVFGLVVSFSLPKTYKTKVMLSPETNSGSKSLGNLGAISSMLGSSLSMDEDAINPQYYPNVFRSTKFIVSLFDVQLESIDGKLKTNLYDYCKNHQERPWWSPDFGSKEEDTDTLRRKQLPGVYLTKEQDRIVEMIRDMLTCNYDTKNEFITITATTQDALISTELVDSVSKRLQSFIVEYRTSKARHDEEHIQKLFDEAAQRYKRARIKYANYSDAYDKLVLQSYITTRDELENQMQLEYTIYSQLAQQLQMAKGKVLEQTPVFAVIEPATVPLRKNGPKRMLIILGWLIVAFMGTSAWLYYKRC